MMFKAPQDHWLSCRVIFSLLSQTQNHTPRTFLAQGLCTCCIFYQKQISPRYLHGSFPFMSFWCLLKSHRISDALPDNITQNSKLYFLRPNPTIYLILLLFFILPYGTYVMYYIMYSFEVFTECSSPLQQSYSRAEIRLIFITLLSLMTRTMPHTLKVLI